MPLRPYIRYIHISDNEVIKSDYFEQGKVNIQFTSVREYFEKISGMIVIELINPDDLEGAILGSREYLEKILS
jgi:sugar phosphate isomerase/epimerase